MNSAPLFDSSENDDSRVCVYEEDDQNEHEDVQYGANRALDCNKKVQNASEGLQHFHLQR